MIMLITDGPTLITPYNRKVFVQEENGSYRAMSCNHRRNGLEKEAKIEGNAPLIDVFQVHLNPLIESAVPRSPARQASVHA